MPTVKSDRPARTKKAGNPPAATEPFDAMTDAEKEAVWESFNRPIDPNDLRPMTAAERKRWAATQASLKARQSERRGRGRPVVGKGARHVQVTIEGDLLMRADSYAKRNHMKRSQLVAAGLRLAMATGVTADTVNG